MIFSRFFLCHWIVQYIIRRGRLGSSSLGCIIAAASTTACRWNPTYVHGRPLRRKISAWIQLSVYSASFGWDLGSAGPGCHDAPIGPALASSFGRWKLHQPFRSFSRLRNMCVSSPTDVSLAHRPSPPTLRLDASAKHTDNVVCTTDGGGIGRVGRTTRRGRGDKEEADIASKNSSSRNDETSASVPRYLLGTIDLQTDGRKVPSCS